ncbi:hypothetical protein [Paenibacillus thermotolerans]|uniref:hypothetical protein n=1 Tax=Paenibacillus thermotolerans TaxID=3027807 RepID=UPI002368E634|nr:MULTISPECIES: hypothetical protein [unclassified Paenibacillus]
MKRRSGTNPNEPGPDNESDEFADEKVSRRQTMKANIWLWHRRLMFWGSNK